MLFYDEGRQSVMLAVTEAGSAELASKDCREISFHDALTLTLPQAQDDPRYQLLGRLVNARLDAFARTRGYDSALSCVSYANSKHPAFKADAERLSQLRDETWLHISDMERGLQQQVLSVKEFLGSLPDLTW